MSEHESVNDELSAAAASGLAACSTDAAILQPLTAEDKRLKWMRWACQFIDPDHLRIEPELFESKWFDYRFLSPAEATEKFADAYRQKYQEAWRRYMDRHEAAHKLGLPKWSVFRLDRRTISGIWSARQAADILGVPYGFFIYQGIEYLFSGRSRHVPRPNQLLNVELAGHVAAEWKKYTADRVVFSSDPHYLNENFCGKPAQIAHREWLMELARKSYGASRRFCLANFCFIDRVLPVEMVEAEFGSELVAKARDEAISGSMIKDPVPTVPAGDLRPGCFGLPYAFQPGSGPCSRCPIQSECETAVAVSCGHLNKRFGTTEPLKEHKLAQNRERQRRFRAKARAAKLVGSSGAS